MRARFGSQDVSNTASSASRAAPADPGANSTSPFPARSGAAPALAHVAGDDVKTAWCSRNSAPPLEYTFQDLPEYIREMEDELRAWGRRCGCRKNTPTSGHN